MASYCQLGNVDPQHGFGTFGPGGAACEQALTIPLPPDGSLLATTRPDVDSIAAMAVLVLRRLDQQCVCGAKLSRIGDIATADSFRAGPWEPRPLPTEAEPWPCGRQPVDGSRSLAHLGVICSPRPGQPSLPLADRVAIVATWILFGDDPEMLLEDGSRTRWCALSPDDDGMQWDFFARDTEIVRCIAQACGSSLDILSIYAAIDAARQIADESRVALAREAQRPGAITRATVAGRGHVAVVRVSHAGALGLGYCVAPVVVAFDRAHRGKVTIAEYGDDGERVDFAALKEALNAAELEAGGSPGWGGPRKLLGSPQRVGTKIQEQRLLAIVAMMVGTQAHRLR
ncbi:MAG TPA: hypothetical protein VFO62_10055 [Candidatus Binatia bacterium]|nr:hypothetical protein [Candidatus Binatia bacterium]